jgi:hypothetical protein
VTLSPNEVASSTVWYDAPDSVNPADCHPTGATALTLQLGTDDTPMQVDFQTVVCAINGRVYIAPLTAGTAVISF